MIFFDLETTGLLKPEENALHFQPYITEIYAVKLNMDPSTFEFEFVDEFETFVRPPIPISEEITRITGITDATLVDAPSFPRVYNKLVDFFLGERECVAHNISFDMGVIRCELMRMEAEFRFPWPPKQTCTVEKSMRIKNHRLSLAKMHEYFFGAPHENAHRARHDVEAMVRCYAEMAKKGIV